MYNNNKISKDKADMKFLEPGVGLKQRKKLSVKLDTNKYFDKPKKEEKKDKKDKKKPNKKSY
jgi:hypothetical protein